MSNVILNYSTSSDMFLFVETCMLKYSKGIDTKIEKDFSRYVMLTTFESFVKADSSKMLGCINALLNYCKIDSSLWNNKNNLIILSKK